MLMPSRKARRISPIWYTVSILCLRFQDCPGDGPYWNGSGWGGSRLDADFRLGGGSLLRADYQSRLVVVWKVSTKLLESSFRVVIAAFAATCSFALLQARFSGQFRPVPGTLPAGIIL